MSASCELTQRTLCSCKLPAGASCQQNCRSSQDLRKKRSQGKRQMRNRIICTQQRGTFFKLNMWGLQCCPPSFNRQPITMTGNVLITLLLLPCNSITVTNSFLMNTDFFLPNQALFCKLMDHCPLQTKTTYTTYTATFFWSPTVWALKRKLVKCVEKWQNWNEL